MIISMMEIRYDQLIVTVFYRIPSADHETWRWDFADMGLHKCKRYSEDDTAL